jgi:exopolyphosphatase/guanosine-5'-triphosphate,3'-diphosphate pyrophosphatase
MSVPVAVVDIGSNSIKILVAVRRADGSVHPLHTRSIDARISAGISRADPHLSAAGMARGLDAIVSLLADARRFSAARTVLVATSAVRDARNGPDFRARILAATGHSVRILTGDEEANLIGRGLCCDPALGALRDFYVFDLGGGSLECLAFRDRRIAQAHSLQLGCVRLTERFVPDSAQPLDPATVAAIADHTRAALAASGFAFNLPPAAAAIGTGGTVSTVRAILGACVGQAFDATPAEVAVADLRRLSAHLNALDLPARRAISGLPSARADVFPAALITLLAVADTGGFPAYRNSLYNLRYGLADEALAAA